MVLHVMCNVRRVTLKACSVLYETDDRETGILWQFGNKMPGEWR